MPANFVSCHGALPTSGKAKVDRDADELGASVVPVGNVDLLGIDERCLSRTLVSVYLSNGDFSALSE